MDQHEQAKEQVTAVKTLAGGLLGIGLYVVPLIVRWSGDPEFSLGGSLVWTIVGIAGFLIGALVIGGIVGAIARVGLLSPILAAVIGIWYVGSHHQNRVETAQFKPILLVAVAAFLVELIVTKVLIARLASKPQRERAERERAERERAQHEQEARERAERERAERERAERERAQHEQEARERAERERAQHEGADEGKAKHDKIALPEFRLVFNAGPPPEVTLQLLDENHVSVRLVLRRKPAHLTIVE